MTTPTPRAPKGSGTIYQTTLRGKPIWFASIELPPRDGKRYRITGTGQSRAQAIQRRNKNYQAHLTGTHRKPTNTTPTLNEYITRYLESKKPTLKPESYRKIERDFANHITPYIGNIHLNDLNEQTLNTHIHTTLKNIGPTARKNTYKNLSALLTHATQRHIIEDNPLKFVSRPNAPTLVKDDDEKFINERVSLYKGILKRMDQEHNPNLPLFITMTLGLRRAELLGLEWNRISNITKPGKATLTISQQLKRYETHEPQTGWYIAPYTKGTNEQPKTRTIYLPETYRKILHNLKKDHDKEPPSTEWHHDLIFKHNHKHTTYKNLETIWNNEWKNYLQNTYEQQRFRIHYVRHICASVLSAQGITIETIQDILGHSDAAISLHYRKQMKEQRQQATLTLEQSFE